MYATTASASSAIALGTGAGASAENSIALGSNAMADASHNIQFGDNSLNYIVKAGNQTMVTMLLADTCNTVPSSYVGQMCIDSSGVYMSLVKDTSNNWKKIKFED